MAQNVLNIAIGATCSKPGDLKGNLAQIRMLADKACANGCDILLTPELSATGYGGYPEVIATAEQAGKGPIYEALSEIASQCGVVLLAGFVERGNGKNHLAHYIVFPDGRFQVQRKNRVTPLEHPLCPAAELYFDGTEEIGQISAENASFTFFHVNGVKCAVVICADVGVKGLQTYLDVEGVQALFVPVGAGGTRENKVTNAELKTNEGKEKYLQLCNNEYFFPGGSIRDSLAHNRAMIAVNMCGFDGKALYHGGSGSVISHFGEIVAFAAGIENIDRQRPVFACGEVDFTQSLSLL